MKSTVREWLRAEYSVGRFRILLRALHLSRKLPRHPEVAQLRRQGLALFQHCDSARYLALREKIPGLAKDLGIAMTFLGRSHEIRNH